MSNIKKIIGVVLALVMALSVATVAFAATGDKYSVAISADKTTLAAGESAIVTVSVTSNYNVSTMSIPVFFDKNLVTVSEASTTLAGDLKEVKIVTEGDLAKFYRGSGYTEADHGVVALTYVAKQGASIETYNNTTVMTFKVTAKADVSGNAVIDCVQGTVKTSANTTGTLYVGKNSSGNAIVDSLAEWIDDADVTAATATIAIGGGATESADLAIQSAYASSGIVIDTNKKFGGKYDGAVYGFTLEGTINAAFYTARLEATNGGSITIVKTPYVTRPVSYGTGATVQVKNADGTLVKTYIIIILGDVSGNGKIGPEDTSAVDDHIAGKTVITDEVKIMAANTVVSGRNDTVKATSLYQIKPDDTSSIDDNISGAKIIDVASIAASHNAYNTYYQ